MQVLCDAPCLWFFMREASFRTVPRGIRAAPGIRLSYEVPHHFDGLAYDLHLTHFLPDIHGRRVGVI